MGGIVKTLFGGSSQKSEQQSQSQSSNKAWDALQGPLTQQVQGGTNTFNTLNDTLGQGFDAYKKNAGYDFQLNQGDQAIGGTAAARGLLNSGSTQKSLAKFQSGLGSTMYNNWLDRLSGAASLGLGAAGALTGAGATSSSSATGNSNGSENKGILSSLFG